MKLQLAYLAHEVCGRLLINVAGHLCDDEINRWVPFRLLGAQGLEILIWNTSPAIDAYK
jgi:hypothetical protein